MPTPERFGRHHRRSPSAGHPDRRASAQPDILARLEQAIGAIQDSDGFRRYLDMQARFHKYSFNNFVLILSQRSDATLVAGYNTWLKLHRYVRRGEQGIRIVVPMRRKLNEEDTPEESRLFFGTGVVFDIKQTDGEPLPEVNVPVLAGESGGGLMDAMLALAGREGVQVRLNRGELPRTAMGAYSPQEKTVRLAAAPMRQMTKTLAHELAHHYAGIDASTEANETIAEATAYVVCAHFGLDTGERSFPYIAVWA